MPLSPDHKTENEIPCRCVDSILRKGVKKTGTLLHESTSAESVSRQLRFQKRVYKCVFIARIMFCKYINHYSIFLPNIPYSLKRILAFREKNHPVFIPVLFRFYSGFISILFRFYSGFLRSGEIKTRRISEVSAIKNLFYNRPHKTKCHMTTTRRGHGHVTNSFIKDLQLFSAHSACDRISFCFI